MGEDNLPLAERMHDRVSRETQGTRQTDFEVTSQQPARFFRHGAFHIRAKQRHPDQGSYANRDAGEEVEKVPPGSPGFTPCHLEDETIHGDDSATRWSASVRWSDSMRPSRNAITRSMEEAIV